MGSVLSRTGACELTQWAVDVTKTSILAEKESPPASPGHDHAFTNNEKKMRKKTKREQEDGEV